MPGRLSNDRLRGLVGLSDADEQSMKRSGDVPHGIAHRDPAPRMIFGDMRPHC